MSCHGLRKSARRNHESVVIDGIGRRKYAAVCRRVLFERMRKFVRSLRGRIKLPEFAGLRGQAELPGRSAMFENPEVYEVQAR